jgi:hypothetical protein
LLKDTTLAPADRAGAIAGLAAEFPVPFAELAPHLGDGTATAVAAVMKSTGPAGPKVARLTAWLDRGDRLAQIAIANGLVALSAKDPPVRDALLSAGYGSNVQLVRAACFAALDALFPGARGE